MLSLWKGQRNTHEKNNHCSFRYKNLIMKMEPETSKAVELIMPLDSWWSGVKAIWFRSIRWRLPVAKLTRTALLLHLGYLKSPSARCVILREVQRSWRLQNPTKTNHSGLRCNTGQGLRDTGVPTACTVPQPHPSVSCGAHALPSHWLECTVASEQSVSLLCLEICP